MKEEFGDAWTLAKSADALCLTTNGFIRANGWGVMGRGIAKQATSRIPGIAAELGHHLKHNGNHVGMLTTVTWSSALPGDPSGGSYIVYAFPVKHVWDQPADMNLIERSCRELMEIVNELHLHRVILPRPGCGNGGLTWAVVKPLIAPLLDDRIVIVEYAPSTE